jgi:receptor tyrosine kinase-like orphan receptor 1
MKPKVRAREFPISAVRFIQEMGDGVFGKVYRGELGGIVGGVTALVAVKTLKPGANSQTREDFQRESELMADLRHPNIVCLIGVVTKDEPR